MNRGSKFLLRRFSNQIDKIILRKKWTINQLVQAYDLERPYKSVLDPDSVLRNETKASIAKLISSIKAFDTKFVVINEMDKTDLERTDDNPLIHDFSEQFLMKIMPEQEDRMNNILVFYSLVDRSYRFRTGRNARKRLSDSLCEMIANSVKNRLRENDYDGAFNVLFTLLRTYILYGRFIGFSIFVAIFILIWAMVLATQIEQKKTQTLNQRIEKIKELEKLNPNFKTLTDEFCVICLQRFQSSIEHPPEDYSHPSVGAILEEKKQLDKDFQPATENSQIVAEDFQFASCKHRFHQVCINDWFKRNTSCPICSLSDAVKQKAALNREDDHISESFLREFLLGVQRSYWSGRISPQQVNNYYYYGSFDNPNEKPTKSSSSSRNSSGFKYDSGSGGVSGKW